MNNSINAKIERLNSEFEILDNPMDKYQHIIDLGKDKKTISTKKNLTNNKKKFSYSRGKILSIFSSISG